jgi:hypothetical protein
MDLKKWISSIDLLTALRQFPVSCLFACVGSVSALLLVDNDNSDILAKLLLASYLTFLAGILVEVWARSNTEHFLAKIILILPFLIFAGWYLYLPNDFDQLKQYEEQHLAYQYAGWTLILHLIISFIPYLRVSQEEDFWEYNKNLFLRIAESVLFSLVIFIGLSVALLALDKLFGLEVKGEWYLRLFIFQAGIFNSLYFLSKYPKVDYNGLVSPPQQSYLVFSQYILIPIALVYLILLYAYGGKIVIENELPRGWIGQLTLWFSVVGIITWLLNYFNSKFSDSAWTKVYINHFFKFLTVPIILLFVAITVRLNDYGLTENRYIVATLAVWLAILVVLFGWLKKPHIRFIPISLAILAAFSIFSGPLDMFSSTLRNQSHRLKKALVENNLLADGAFSKEIISDLPDSIKFQISNLIHGLSDRSDLEIINNWTTDNLFAEYHDSLAIPRSQFLIDQLGLNANFMLPGNYERSNYFNFSLNKSEPLLLHGYASMKWVSLVTDTTYMDNALLIKNRSDVHLPGYGDISLLPIINHYREYEYAIPPDKMTIELADSTRSVKLVFEFLNGSFDHEGVKVEGGSGWMFEK